MSEVAVIEIPEGWVEMPLEDCVDILDSQRVPLNSKQRSARIAGKPKSELFPYYGATGAVGFIDDFIFEGEHLLIGEDAAPFFDKSKAVAYITNGKFWVNNHAHILNANSEITSNKYLLHYLNRFNFKGYVNGTTRLKLNQGNLKIIPVPLPPLEQQKRIVAKIEELFSHIDAGIEALNKAKQLLKQYRQSVLKAAVTGKLTEQWRADRAAELDALGRANAAGAGATIKDETAQELLERIFQERRQKWEEQQLDQFKAKGKMPKNDKWKANYKGPIAYSYEGALPRIPETWAWASPEELASTDKYSLAIGPFGSNLKVLDYREEGVPLVFVRNIRRDEYRAEGGKFVTTEKAEELKAHSISAGDVLITKMGEPPGDASIYPDKAVDAIITADCIKWRFSRFINNQRLYVHLINSQIIRSQIIGRTRGVAQKKVSLGAFKSVTFPVPPLEEQKVILQEIESKFESIERLEKEVGRQLIKAEKSKQSILASVFSGKI